MNKKDLIKNTTEKTALIDGLYSILEKKVLDIEKVFLKIYLEKFFEKLDKTEGGRIKPSLRNKRLLSMIDKVFKDFGKSGGIELVEIVVSGVMEVVNFNKRYFTILNDNPTILPIQKQVLEIVKNWLGIEPNGKVSETSYLNDLIENKEIKKQIKDISLKSVVGQKGWQDAKAEIENFVLTTEESEGVFRKYSRNYVYDLYAKTDRAVQETYKDSLKYRFAIYEGGLIKTSRKFCKERNGKIFHVSEIEDFSKSPDKPKMANYDPFIDLGGYACRHHLSWIPDSLAKAMGKNIDDYR